MPSVTPSDELERLKIENDTLRSHLSTLQDTLFAIQKQLTQLQTAHDEALKKDVRAAPLKTILLAVWQRGRKKLKL
jgi:predicted  nucleic acid-binding Zn-ribbon protein